MFKSRIQYLILFTCITFLGKTQINKAKFLHDFSNSGSTEKIRLVASYPFEDIKDIYPLIQDTFIRIRKSVFQTPPSVNKEVKFLFDKIEADKEMYERNYAKSIFILENCLQRHTRNINDSLKCWAALKNSFLKIRNYNKAIEINHILELKWKNKLPGEEIDFGVKKSNIYFEVGLVDKALMERRKEYRSVDQKDTALALNYYNDMGVFYNSLKKSDTAEFYFLRAKKILAAKKPEAGKEVFYTIYKGLIDGNLALSYFNKGDVQQAIPLLKNDIYYSSQSDNYGGAFNAYNILIQCYISLKNKELAKAYLDSARDVLRNRLRNNNSLHLKFLPTEASYYNLISDYKLSSATYRNYFAMHDSFTALEKEQDVVNQSVIFNIEQREMEFVEKENLLKQIQLDDARQRSYRAYLLAGVLILSLIIVFLFINNRMFKKRETQLQIKNKQIRNQNAQIEQSLKEKEALIKEIHHRVKNNLQIITSMLNLQMSKLDDEKTAAILFEAKQRINAIALTHQMLYQKTTISNINVGEYVENLVKQIEATVTTTGIQLVTDIVPTESRLPIDGAVPLGLIINELVTNAYKHAFPLGKKGTITVALIKNEETYTIVVKDNGIGVSDDFEKGESKTLGMELVFILIEQLDSKLIIENENGSSFRFDIKKT